MMMRYHSQQSFTPACKGSQVCGKCGKPRPVHHRSGACPLGEQRTRILVRKLVRRGPSSWEIWVAKGYDCGECAFEFNCHHAGCCIRVP